MSINPLNDISRVYLENVAESAVPGKPAEKLGAVTSIPKTEQDAARKRTLAKAKAMREKKGIEEAFVDPEQGEAPSGRSPLQNVSDHPKASVRKKAVGAFKKQMGKEYGGTWKSRSKDPVSEALDPVGKEDADIDNDGDTDRSDKYLHKRRKAIGKAIATQKEALDPVGKEDADIDNDGKKNTKKDKYLIHRRNVIKQSIATQKEAKFYDPMDDPDFDPHEAEKNRGVSGKNNPKGGKPLSASGKKKTVKEGYSNWREDLIEVVDKVETNKKENQKISEKNINNKIVINPKLDLGEAVSNIGGTLLEVTEIEHFNNIFEEMSETEIFFLSDDLIEEVVEEFFYECLEEGYNLEHVENSLLESIEFSALLLNEAKVTFGHDTKIKSDRLDRVKSAVKKVGGAVKSAAKAELHRIRYKGAGKPQKPTFARRAASSLKSGFKKAVASGARKVAKGAIGVARRMSDSKPKAAPKKAEKLSDPWEGSATTPTKAKAKKAAAPKAKAPAKKKKTSKLDALLADVRSESVIGDRARSAVADDRLSSEQEKTSASMDKLRAQTKRHEKSTALARTQARIAAKKSEDTARAMHPKPGVSGYRIEETEIDEAKQAFPFKKVEAQKEKARKGSVYGKDTGNQPAPQVSDAEKKATTRFSKMQHTYEKEKRAKQEADKARRSSTFYKDTHPASSPKMKKANEEFQLDEKTLTSSETKKKEEIVKSMKDKAADFEKRYPGRGKEVMYATATKMAKKISEQALELQPKTSTKEKPLDTSLERQKYSNLKMMQQKQQQLQKQKLNLQKQGKLPLETD